CRVSWRAGTHMRILRSPVPRTDERGLGNSDNSHSVVGIQESALSVSIRLTASQGGAACPKSFQPRVLPLAIRRRFLSPQSKVGTYPPGADQGWAATRHGFGREKHSQRPDRGRVPWGGSR